MRFQYLSNKKLFGILAKIVSRKTSLSEQQASMVLHGFHDKAILAYKQWVLLAPAKQRQLVLHFTGGR